jgi:shikimate kinase
MPYALSGHGGTPEPGETMTPPRMLAAGPDQSCVSLIGMAACGKSAIGKALAAYLGWGHLDTDHMMEAAYAVRLQTLTDTLVRQEFLDLEDTSIRALRLRRTIISTGGSAVYNEGAMRHLASLGPIVHIDVPLPVILERIARKPERGLVIMPGQSVEDLFAERCVLYRAWRTHTYVTTGTGSVCGAGREIAGLLRLRPDDGGHPDPAEEGHDRDT